MIFLHSSINSYFLLGIDIFFIRVVLPQLLGKLFLPPARPDQLALFKTCFFGELEPPSILEYRPHERKIIATSYKKPIMICLIRLHLISIRLYYIFYFFIITHNFCLFFPIVWRCKICCYPKWWCHCTLTFNPIYLLDSLRNR